VTAFQCAFFFSGRRRHTRFSRDWSSDVCSSDLHTPRDRRTLLPITPVERRNARAVIPGHGAVSPEPPELAPPDLPVGISPASGRSEERRVGKEGRLRVSAEDCRKSSIKTERRWT